MSWVVRCHWFILNAKNEQRPDDIYLRYTNLTFLLSNITNVYDFEWRFFSWFIKVYSLLYCNIYLRMKNARSSVSCPMTMQKQTKKNWINIFVFLPILPYIVYFHLYRARTNTSDDPLHSKIHLNINSFLVKYNSTIFSSIFCNNILIIFTNFYQWFKHHKNSILLSMIFFILFLYNYLIFMFVFISIKNLPVEHTHRYFFKVKNIINACLFELICNMTSRKARRTSIQCVIYQCI
jgi:hypothetical protein